MKECMSSVDRLGWLIDNSKSLDALRQSHARVLRRGLEEHPIPSFKLQRSYSAHGRLDLAVVLFHSNWLPNVFFWTALIHAHARSGRPFDTVSLFEDMGREQGRGWRVAEMLGGETRREEEEEAARQGGKG